MNHTPNSTDDLRKLLDNGHTVVLRQCNLGTYFAVCVKRGTEAEELVSDAVDRAIGWTGEYEDEQKTTKEFDEAMPGVVETEDFSPSEALYRLVEKATTGRIV